MKRLLTLLLIFWTAPAFAHQGAHPLTRLVLVEAAEGGTRVTVQVPAMLAFAHAAAARETPSSPIKAPFLTTSFSQFGTSYVVEAAAIAQQPSAAAALIAPVMPLDASVPHAVLSARAFSLEANPQMLVTDVVVEVVLFYSDGSDLALTPMASPPPLPPMWYLETLISDTRATPAFFAERIGPLDAPIVIAAP